MESLMIWCGPKGSMVMNSCGENGELECFFVPPGGEMPRIPSLYVESELEPTEPSWVLYENSCLGDEEFRANLVRESVEKILEKIGCEGFAKNAEWMKYTMKSFRTFAMIDEANGD